jgi:hypothetical protein
MFERKATTRGRVRCRAVEVRAQMRQDEGGRWVATTDTDPPVRATGSSSERCLAALNRSLKRSSLDEPVTLTVEMIVAVAGVAEAAQIMGWDKRRVITYIGRGRFPEPVQSLASGRLWLRSDVEHFAKEWRARQSRRSSKGPGRA